MLSTLGWGPFFSSQLEEHELLNLLPGRAVADQGPRLLVQFEDRAALVVVPGRLRDAGASPVVGDFVLAAPGDEPSVVRVLERRSALSRGAAGRAVAEQVLAANVDRVLVVQPLDAGVNPRRLERTLAAARASGADPGVLLTKADLAADPGAARAEAEAVAGGAPVLLVSTARPEGLEPVRALVPAGATAALIGPSGAGKSTLLNGLLGADLQATAEVRAGDRRGRHTTTGRRLVPVPGGGALVDGPGIRELKLWEPGGLEQTFEDVAALAAGCRFTDCRHEGEPGCAVAAAVAAGALDPGRLESLRKLEREAAALAARQPGAAARAERARWRAVSRERRRFQRARGT
jgi:ribosome biogenesis GTPase